MISSPNILYTFLVSGNIAATFRPLSACVSNELGFIVFQILFFSSLKILSADATCNVNSNCCKYFYFFQDFRSLIFH